MGVAGGIADSIDSAHRNEAFRKIKICMTKFKNYNNYYLLSIKENIELSSCSVISSSMIKVKY